MNTVNEKFNPVRQTILDQVAANALPSLSVAVIHHGQVLWKEAFGWADRVKAIPATPETIYPLASVSKSITAVGVMILVERGLVDLDAPILRYLAPKDFAAPRNRLSEVTVRHLLNMNAGIPHLWKYDYPNNPGSRLNTAELVRRFGFLADVPGRAHYYSNLSYGVLELLIQQVTGRPFPEYMGDELFAPLGMENTSLKTGIRPGALLSTAYTADNQPVPDPFSLEPAGGAGFYSSLDDLIRYAQFHLGELSARQTVLSPALLQTLHVEADPKAPNYRTVPIAGYVMGWGVVEDGQYTSLWSNGAMLGCSAMVMLVPAEAVGVVCVSNHTSPVSIADRTAIEIVGALLPGFAENLQAKMAELESSAPPPPNSGLFGNWRGSVSLPGGPLPLHLTIRHAGESTLKVGDQPEVALHDAQLSNETLEGQAETALPLAATLNCPHNLALHLHLQGDNLAGVARAESSGDRPHFGLPFSAVVSRSEPSNLPD